MSIVSEIINFGGYEIQEAYITPDQWARPEIKINPTIGALHWTGNINEGADDVANRNYIERLTGGYASAHTFGDSDSLIVLIPFMPNYAEEAYHVGAATYKPRFAGKTPNMFSLGHEMCVNKDGNFRESYKRGVFVMAYWSYLYNWNPQSDLVRHFDVTGKLCPFMMLDDVLNYNKVYSMVSSMYGNISDPNIKKSKIDSGVKFIMEELHIDGVRGEQLWTKFKNDVQELLSVMKANQGDLKSKGENSMKPEVIKERVYSENGVLKQAHKADGSSDYSKSATDVRYIKFNKDTFKLKLVWAKGKTVSQLVKENNADYGFNFPFFHETTFDPIADCKIGNTILNRGYDTPNGAQQTKWHGFAYKNGQPVIGQFNVNDDLGSDGFLVKTTPLLLNGQGSEVWDWYRVQDGTASDIGKSGNAYVRAQRTVVGLDAEGNLHLAVGDGRTKYDRGLDLQEMALYMKSKGCLWALNGDGGGSSVLADHTGSLGQNKGTDERVVHHAILVYLKQEEKVDPLKLQRDKLAELENQIAFMKSYIDESGSGEEQWALSYLEQVYDIMLTKKLVKEV